MPSSEPAVRRQRLEFHDCSANQRFDALARTLVIAGWTGRDRAQLDSHILELEALGVRRPHNVPTFYHLASNLLVQAESIEVVSADSSGEAEAVIMAFDGGLWVGVGSDHTDRRLEAVNVTAAKQVCAKPLGTAVWPLSEVQDHWDALLLRSYVGEGESRELYQCGPLGNNLAVGDLIGRYGSGEGLQEGTVMFCGTLPVIGKLRGASRFEVELEDPLLRRTLTLAYAIDVLPAEEGSAQGTSAAFRRASQLART